MVCSIKAQRGTFSCRFIIKTLKGCGFDQPDSYQDKRRPNLNRCSKNIITNRLEGVWMASRTMCDTLSCFCDDRISFFFLAANKTHWPIFPFTVCSSPIWDDERES